MGRNWHNLVQKSIFSLLLLNTCLLAGAMLGLFDSREAPPLAADLPVRQDSGGLFGNIRLTTEDNLTLPQARVLINGLPSGDFGSGELLLRVYEGDTLTIDAGAYKTRLNFHIRAVSSNIETVSLPPLIITDGDIITLPPIGFR